MAGSKHWLRWQFVVGISPVVIIALIVLLGASMRYSSDRYNALVTGMSHSQVKHSLHLYRERRLPGLRGGNITPASLAGHPGASVYRYSLVGLPPALGDEMWLSIYVAYDSHGRLICWDNND